MISQLRFRLSVCVTVAPLLLLQSGCNTPARRSSVASSITSSSEPALSTGPTTSDTVVVEPSTSARAGTTQPISFVDRHPLFRKPQQYYDNTNSNKVVKTAAAAFVGVPVGFVGELKQIVVGTPSTPVPTAYVPR